MVTLGLAGSTAYAQAIDRRYAEDPTGGLALPTTPLAGEHDARAVVANPGGLALLRGPEFALGLDFEDDSVATSSGPGVGLYGGGSVGGSLLPRLGWGVGLEWLRPARAQLEPDPGEPFRASFALAIGLGSRAGFGVAWHRFREDGILNGINTFDLGVSWRVENHLAVGATVRDLDTQAIGGVPIERKYEAEAVLRPLGTEQLEVALGGRLGETHYEVDGWARVSARLARGLYLHAQLETRELHAQVDSPSGVVDDGGRDVRATVGFEVSLGNFGVTALATGLRDDTGANHMLGGTLVLRASTVGPASIAGMSDHIERVELAGTIGARELTAIVMRLREIARDPSAKALLVTFDGAAGGWATLQELRDEILAVKAKKKVFAYIGTVTGREYFVASAADKIYIDPAGGLRLIGMAGTSLFFRGTFDLLGVVPEFTKIGEYKSAPEQFTDTHASDAAAHMHDAMLDSIWTGWLAAIAAGRHLSVERVKAVIDAGPYSAGALANNTELVDAVGAPDRVGQLVAQELGRVLEIDRPIPARPDRWRHPGVAIIYVDGDITDGKSQTVPFVGEKLAGGETLIKAIADAREDEKIGAIVLRINSPGGSALASELVAREIFATRGVKPVVCSMSDVAASGGYFVAAGCDLIFAEPMTITGSIGIFTGKFDISGLTKRLGITTESWSRGKRADTESLFHPYTDDERAAVMKELEYMYGRFVGAVAEGRGMSKEAVDAVGRGHVFTGADAKPLKLLDRFGGIGDAIDEAKRRMHVAKDAQITLVEMPAPPTSVLEAVVKLVGGPSESKLEVTDLPVIRELVRSVPLSILVAPTALQARLPFELIWD